MNLRVSTSFISVFRNLFEKKFNFTDQGSTDRHLKFFLGLRPVRSAGLEILHGIGPWSALVRYFQNVCPSMIPIYRYLSTNRQNEPPKTDVNMFISEFSNDLRRFF